MKDQHRNTLLFWMALFVVSLFLLCEMISFWLWRLAHPTASAWVWFFS